MPENYIFPLYQFDTHKSFILNIYLKEYNSPALALLLAALWWERRNNASFFKIENPRRFFFCLHPCSSYSAPPSVSRNTTGKLFIAWSQNLSEYCRYHSQTTQSIHVHKPSNSYCSTPWEPTTNTKGRFISRQTSITKHMKIDSNTWIIPEGFKTTFSKWNLTCQMKCFRFLYPYFSSAIHRNSALDHRAF